MRTSSTSATTRNRRLSRLAGGLAFAVVTAVAALNVPVQAHHSFSIFDTSKTRVFTGVVTRVNPDVNHLQIFFAVMNDERTNVNRDAKTVSRLSGRWKWPARRRRRSRASRSTPSRRGRSSAWRCTRFATVSRPATAKVRCSSVRRRRRPSPGSTATVSKAVRHSATVRCRRRPRNRDREQNPEPGTATGGPEGLRRPGDSRGHRLIFEFAQWLEMTPVSVTIKSVKWIVPAVQSVHIITIGIVFVSLLTIAMRVLGLDPHGPGLRPRHGQVHAVDP